MSEIKHESNETPFKFYERIQKLFVYIKIRFEIIVNRSIKIYTANQLPNN